MDTIYYYWHPDERPKKAPEADRGGFSFPFHLVVMGWQEWQKTGRYPNPYELAKRIVPGFKDDIDYFDTLIERGRPRQDGSNDG